jgi:hypothetical protein
MEISSVSISFGPGTSPAPESPDRRRFRVARPAVARGRRDELGLHRPRRVDADVHARRASLMEALASVDFAIDPAIAVLKTTDKKRQAAIAAVMNGN